MTRTGVKVRAPLNHVQRFGRGHIFLSDPSPPKPSFHSPMWSTCWHPVPLITSGGRVALGTSDLPDSVPASSVVPPRGRQSASGVGLRNWWERGSRFRKLAGCDFQLDTFGSAVGAHYWLAAQPDPSASPFWSTEVDLTAGGG